MANFTIEDALYLVRQNHPDYTPEEMNALADVLLEASTAGSFSEALMILDGVDLKLVWTFSKAISWEPIPKEFLTLAFFAPVIFQGQESLLPAQLIDRLSSDITARCLTLYSRSKSLEIPVEKVMALDHPCALLLQLSNIK